MKKIRITKSEFDKLGELQLKPRMGWHAVFSSNLSENTWPFVTFGLTPEELRIEVEKRSPILIQIVGIYTEIRPSGGRFFIDRKGVFFHPENKDEQFIEWKFDDPSALKTITLKPLSYEEGLASMRANRLAKQRTNRNG